MKRSKQALRKRDLVTRDGSRAPETCICWTGGDPYDFCMLPESCGIILDVRRRGRYHRDYLVVVQFPEGRFSTFSESLTRVER